MHVLEVDASSDLLRDVQQIGSGGAKPWGAEISPNGRWLVVANQASDVVNLFAIDPDTGLVSPTAGTMAVASPTAATFAAL